MQTRREFIRNTLAYGGGIAIGGTALGQEIGERPPAQSNIKILNPRGRVPVGIIIDDSTCLVNLNRFAMPQFDEAFGGRNKTYHRRWKDWPVEIPDSFVRRFAEWAQENGVKGKYSVVPYPACVGRVDRVLPGWSQKELKESLELVRTAIMPNWDIHPEMVTHTRVINTKTGHPYEDHSLKYMENWDWSVGKSVDELTDYLSYALTILKNAGLPCEGVTTPGGFGSRARPQLAQAVSESVRDVFGAEVPHYFRDLHASGTQSVAPQVFYARGLNSPDPRCAVSIVGCTGDWTGGWDCTPPEGADKFITKDLSAGRMVEVIERGEPALIVCHWTGIYWNGEEFGFQIFQEVVRRLHQRFQNLVWMKLSEIARYWAAKELTRIESTPAGIKMSAPYACPDFTVSVKGQITSVQQKHEGKSTPIQEAGNLSQIKSGSWHKSAEGLTLCFNLPKGESEIVLAQN